MKRIFVSLLLAFFCIAYLHAQEGEGVTNMGGVSSSVNQTAKHNDSFSHNGNIRLLTIGIGSFNDKQSFRHLGAFSKLNDFKKTIKYLNQSYSNVYPRYYNKNVVNAEDVRREIEELVKNSQDSDVVIISILSHGDVDEKGEYYLICTDTNKGDYNGTAISGTELRFYIQQIANKGALVLFFLDTCRSAALFKGKNVLLGKGNIAFYASADSNETAKEIWFNTYFTKTIIEIFTDVHNVYGNRGYATLSSIESQINTSLGNVKDDVGQQYQHPKTFYYPGNINIGEYRLFNKPEKTYIPWSSVYLGPSLGTNHSPTPFVNINFGVDINNRHKIEVGFEHSLKKSDEVYIYDKSGILQNALQYKAMSFYARYGFNWLSLGKKKSCFEVITFAGLSGNIVKGSNLNGFNSSVGEAAGSLMGDVCIRGALDLSKNKNRNVLLHVTAGLDFPIIRDDNVEVFEENMYIKNWCSFRPYIDAGLIIKLFNF